MNNTSKKTKYHITSTTKFNKQLKKLKRQGKNIDKLILIVERLANCEKLDAKYKDHQLINNKYFKNYRECHIEPDWLLLYKYNDKQLILFLIATGSHSDIFR